MTSLEALLAAHAEKNAEKNWNDPPDLFPNMYEALTGSFKAGHQSLAPLLLVAVEALYDLRGIYMRRWGTEEKCIAMTPNHEFEIIQLNISRIETALREEK
jgi:hypothetical protein